MAARVGAGGGGIPDVHGRTVKITPASRVYILGAGLCVVLTVCSRYFGDRGGPPFMTWLTVGCVLYLLAIRELFGMSRVYNQGQNV